MKDGQEEDNLVNPPELAYFSACMLSLYTGICCFTVITDNFFRYNTFTIAGKSHIKKLLISHFVISEFIKSLYCGLLFDKYVLIFRDYPTMPSISIPKEKLFSKLFL